MPCALLLSGPNNIVAAAAAAAALLQLPGHTVAVLTLSGVMCANCAVQLMVCVMLFINVTQRLLLLLHCCRCLATLQRC
jgi:hypothetical protein